MKLLINPNPLDKSESYIGLKEREFENIHYVRERKNRIYSFSSKEVCSS